MKGILKRKKSPLEIVKSVNADFSSLEQREGQEEIDQKRLDKIHADLQRDVASLKLVLYGDAENEPDLEQVQIATREALGSNLLSTIVTQFASLRFESKRDLTQIFCNIMRRHFDGNFPAQNWVEKYRPDLLTMLLAFYKDPEDALNGGLMLRECLKHENLSRILLLSPGFYDFFDYVEDNNFDIATDAFSSLKELLYGGKHRELTSGYFLQNYDEFFNRFLPLLTSSNYVTKRQSIRLLGELLLDKAHFSVMRKYISDYNNLKLMMTLLKDPSTAIQFEAFHVFKVFVANPNKNERIISILSKNREKLLKYLTSFHNDKIKEDQQFETERGLVIKEIESMI